ncbi:hypothetical protein MSPP1_002553 [Malassezia sp. CBS 17886]|nr:hypothetical protein MSPP1_002553 [Malassezia sp. CBS 17886]
MDTEGAAHTRLCLRPLVVRFTDAHMGDAHMDLLYERVQDDDERRWPFLSEETVRQLKDRIIAEHASLDDRRLRLIHLGRVLPNGVRLASWLDALELQQDSGSEAQLACERVSVEKSSGGDGTYMLRRCATGASDDGPPTAKLHGKQRLDAGRELRGAGPWELDVTRLPVAYLQCSIGAPHSGSGRDCADDGPVPSATAQPRGFDRLRHTAGMSALDVQVMREHFHQRSGISQARSGDLLRRHEEDELALALEEQWIDNLSDEPLAAAPGRPSVPLSILKGLLIGFFVPILPFFFSYEANAIRWPRRHTPTQPTTPALTHDQQQTQELERTMSQLVASLGHPRARPRDAPPAGGRAASPRAGDAAEPVGGGTVTPRADGATGPVDGGAAAPRADGATAPRAGGADDAHTQRTIAELLLSLTVLQQGRVALQQAQARANAAREEPAAESSGEESDMESPRLRTPPPTQTTGPWASSSSALDSQYVVFSPYTHFAIVLGFLINMVLGIVQLLW